MRFSVFYLLAAAVATNAFAPTPTIRTPGVSFTRLTADSDPVAELCDNVVSRTETVLGKVDELVLGRAIRLVNHLPALYTLKQLGAAAGSAKYGVDAAASAFSVASPALLGVPVALNNVWRLICIAQLASIAKSALANDRDELSQKDIAALTASNWAAAKILTSSTPLRWMAATSIISGYSARNGADGDLTIHTAALQLMSSFTAVATILGAANAAPAVVPFLAGKAELLAGLGLAGFYAAATRGGNGKTKKVVNAAVIGGILWSKIAGGALALTRSNLLNVGTLVTIGTAYVAYEAVTKAKDALA